MKKVWVVEWNEYEDGWGSRPDGVSLHMSKEECEKWTDREIRKYSGIHTSDPMESYEKHVPEHVYKEVVGAGGSKKYGNTPF